MVVTMLLFVSALFARSTVAGLKFDPGFNSTGLAIAWIDQTPSRGDVTRARAANRRVLDTVRDATGVVRTALTTRLPGSASHAFGTRARKGGEDSGKSGTAPARGQPKQPDRGLRLSSVPPERTMK